MVEGIVILGVTGFVLIVVRAADVVLTIGTEVVLVLAESILSVNGVLVVAASVVVVVVVSRTSLIGSVVGSSLDFVVLPLFVNVVVVLATDFPLFLLTLLDSEVFLFPLFLIRFASVRCQNIYIFKKFVQFKIEYKYNTKRGCLQRHEVKINEKELF